MVPCLTYTGRLYLSRSYALVTWPRLCCYRHRAAPVCYQTTGIPPGYRIYAIIRPFLYPFLWGTDAPP